jgi:hypothetical protein
MRAAWICLVVLSSSLAACGRTAAFGPSGGEASDAGPSRDASTTPDSGRLDSGLIDTGGPLLDTGCTTALAPIPSVPIDDEQQAFVVDAFPIAGGTVVLSRQDGLTSLVGLERGESKVIGAGVEQIIDATATAVLGAQGGRLVVLSEGGTPLSGVLRPPFRGTRSRYFDNDRLVLCARTRELTLFDARTFETLASTRVLSCPSLVYASPRGILLGTDESMVGGLYELWNPSSSAPVPTIGPASGPLGGVIFGDTAYTLEFGQVVAHPLAAPTRAEIFHPGPCAWLEANATHLVVGCGGSSSSMIPGISTQLEVYDGRTRTTIDTGGRPVLSPQLGDGFLAWLEYQDDSALCSATPASGRLMVQDLVGRGTPTALAGLDAPCLCCGAFWPEPELIVRGDTAVYTYASGVLSIPGRPRHAAQVLRRQCR